MRVFLALVFAFLPPVAAGAVVTTSTPLSNTSWTDLGAGPMEISAAGTAVYAISDTTPTFFSTGFPVPTSAQAIQTTSHVWAMAQGYAGATAYTAPILNSGGGASGGAGESSNWRGGGSTTTTAAITIGPASGSASLYEYVSAVQCFRDDGAQSAVNVTLNNVAANVLTLPNNGGGGGVSVTYPVPLKVAPNTAVTATPSGAVATLRCFAQGFYGS